MVDVPMLRTAEEVKRRLPRATRFKEEVAARLTKVR